MAQRLKHLPAMWETWVRSLGWEDPLEKEMATHSSTLAWRIPWTEELGGLQSTGSQSRTRLRDFTFTLVKGSSWFHKRKGWGTGKKKHSMSIALFLGFSEKFGHTFLVIYSYLVCM